MDLSFILGVNQQRICFYPADILSIINKSLLRKMVCTEHLCCTVNERAHWLKLYFVNVAKVLTEIQLVNKTLFETFQISHFFNHNLTKKALIFYFFNFIFNFFFFFIWHRLCFERFKEFCGSGWKSRWSQSVVEKQRMTVTWADIFVCNAQIFGANQLYFSMWKYLFSVDVQDSLVAIHPKHYQKYIILPNMSIY